MDASLKLWAVIVIVGALNYVSRLSFIAVFSRRAVPPLLTRAFRYVPAAMLTALVLPMIAASSDGGSWPVTKIVAAVIAGVVAYFTHSTLKTLAAGMSALWVLQAIGAGMG